MGLTPPPLLSILLKSVHYTPSRESRPDKYTNVVLCVSARICFVLNLGPNLSMGSIGGVSSNSGPEIGDSLFLILIAEEWECTTSPSVMRSMRSMDLF